MKRSAERIISFFKMPKNRKILIIGAAALLLLIIINAFSQNNAQNTGTQENCAAEDFDPEKYTERMEKRIKKIVSNIEGVGKVDVMVTLSSGKGLVYATESETSSDCSDDGHVGKKKIQQNETYLKVKEGTSKEKPLLLSVSEPTIKGILIICDGASSAKTRLEITEAMKATLGVASNNIYIAKYN